MAYYSTTNPVNWFTPFMGDDSWWVAYDSPTTAILMNQSGQALTLSGYITPSNVVINMVTFWNSVNDSSPAGVVSGFEILGSDLIAHAYFGNTLSLALQIMSGNDTILASDYNDSLVGYTGDDVMYMYGGNDWAHGGQGNDFLYGGTGGDTLNGGVGIDTIAGGLGADYLTGGSDSDSFVFSSSLASNIYGADFIADFQDGLDKIDFSLDPSVRSVNDLSLTVIQGNTVIYGPGGYAIVLAGDYSQALNASDFYFHA